MVRRGKPQWSHDLNGVTPCLGDAADFQYVPEIQMPNSLANQCSRNLPCRGSTWRSRVHSVDARAYNHVQLGDEPRTASIRRSPRAELGDAQIGGEDNEMELAFKGNGGRIPLDWFRISYWQQQRQQRHLEPARNVCGSRKHAAVGASMN